MSDSMRVTVNPFTGAQMPTYRQSELLTHLVQEFNEADKAGSDKDKKPKEKKTTHEGFFSPWPGKT